MITVNKTGTTGPGVDCASGGNDGGSGCINCEIGRFARATALPITVENVIAVSYEIACRREVSKTINNAYASARGINW